MVSMGDLGMWMARQEDLQPPKQTWNLKMDPWKRRFLLETSISRFNVNFWGCNFDLWVRFNLKKPMLIVINDVPRLMVRRCFYVSLTFVGLFWRLNGS